MPIGTFLLLTGSALYGCMQLANFFHYTDKIVVDKIVDLANHSNTLKFEEESPLDNNEYIRIANQSIDETIQQLEELVNTPTYKRPLSKIIGGPGEYFALKSLQYIAD